MVADLSRIEEELAKIRFLFASFFVLIYFGILGGTLMLSLLYPQLLQIFVVISFFEIFLGFLLLSSYGTLIENLRRRRRKIEKKRAPETATEQKTEA